MFHDTIYTRVVKQSIKSFFQKWKKAERNIMSKILNKIFDTDLYNTVKAERYELDQNGNKNMYNIGQLEGLAEQGNEEAKAIVDKVNSEVDEMLKKMDNGDYLFKTFNEYILEMARLTEEASKQRDEVEAKHDKAEKAWKEARSAINVSDSWTSARKTEYLLANEEYDKSCIGIYNDLKQKLTALKSEFHIHLKGFYAVTPDRIDNNTIALLNSGIDVSEEEIDRLLFKYRFNTTMIRMISSYAKKNKKGTNLLTAYTLAVKSGGKAEMNAFNRFMGFCTDSVSTNNAVRRANASCLDRLGAEALESLDEIAIRPQ